MKIGLLGYGTVGSGVYELLEKNKEKLSNNYNKNIEITKILVRTKEKYADLKHFDKFTTDFEELINSELDVIIEVMGGLSPAYEYVKAALENKCHVITANKDLIAEYFHELHNLSSENNVSINYEASVGGGIPVLKTLKKHLKCNYVTGIYGIINGTTNYILSQMYSNNLSYDEVLKIAQDKGFAEQDPTSDVEGLDAARKLAILSILAFKHNVNWKDIKTVGITNIDSADIEYAKELNKKIKLLGIAKVYNNKLYLGVRPVFIKKDNAIAKIDNEFNGVYLESDLTGDLMFYGKGAGKFPTASSILSDLLEVIQTIEGRPSIEQYNNIAVEPFYIEATDWFVRIKTSDISGTTNKIFSIFKNNKISLKTDSFNQEISFKVYDLNEKDLVNKIDELSVIDAKYFLIMKDSDENA